MIMKKIFYILMSVVVLSTTMTSCDDWMDINTSPDNPVTVSYDVVLPSLLFFTIQECFDNTEYQNYLAQALTTTGRAPKVDYSYRGGWGGFPDMNRHPHWRRHYYEIGVNADYMILDALDKGALNYALIGYTLKLHSLMITTDEYGDMPYKDAYHSNTPKYDMQEDIYRALREAVETDDVEHPTVGFAKLIQMYNDPEWIECKTNPIITTKTDRMYAGDLKAYRNLTYALYARWWVRHIPNWGCPELGLTMEQCCDSVIKYVDLALGEGWKEPCYKFDGGTGEKTSMWGPFHSSNATMNLGWPQGRENNLGGCVPTEFLASMLGFYQGALSLDKTKGVSSAYALDPRAERMFQARVGYNTDPMMLRCLKANIGSDVAFNKDYKSEHFPDCFCNSSDSTKALKRSFRANPYTKDDGYINILTEEELLFDKAEAIFWKNPQRTNQEAYNVMIQAVNKSLERYGAYTDTDRPASNHEKLKALFERARLDFRDFGIDMLMQQKFVALYLQPEQWSDIRRYNYSSSKNGISYANTFVYDIKYVPVKKKMNIDPDPEKAIQKFFTQEYVLERPYNLYEPHFQVEGKDFFTGTDFPLSANAWINRLNPDPETEDKYNRPELERLNAYKNPDYLRKRMIWQRDYNTGAISTKGIGDWEQFD